MNYYSSVQALSYGTPFIFSLGNRSIGKSFDWKLNRCVRRFMSKKRKFVYMRRYDDDLKRCAPQFFDDIAFKIPTHDLFVEGNGKSGSRFYINGELAGTTIALSATQKYKSVPMPDYDTILFDEFLPEDGKYLSDEVGKALSIYQSIARGDGKVIREDVKFAFIANNVTLNNPYFRELGIRDKIQLGTKYCVDADRAWLVEFINNTEIANEIASTPFGKMIAKTKYGDYALKSQYYLDDDTFVQKPTGLSKYYCTLHWKGRHYGVYEYVDEGLFYVSKKYDPNNKNVFSLTTKDHQPNYIMLYKSRFNPLYTFLKFAYEHALLRFDSQESKYMFLEIMSYNV